MTYEMIYGIVCALWLVLSYIGYYWTGKVLGGIKHGKMITAVVIMLFWIVNSLVNTGGINWLVYLIKNLDGFLVGLVGFGLVPMQVVAYLGTRKPLYIFGRKEKWLV